MASAHEHHIHHLPTPYATTTAPPPTPSTQPNNLGLSTSDAADSLSRLLHRLPPTLSLSFPNRRQTTTTSPPLISFSDPTPTLHSNLLSAAKHHGFFQLTHHPIPPHLATSAETESLSIFNQKQLCSFPKNNWPLGFDDDDEDDKEEVNVNGRTFCLDSSCSVESTELELTSLREFSCQMEKLGLEVIKELACAVGFENPVGDDPTRLCSLMWISEGGSGNKEVLSGRLYPFAVGLHYQMRCRKYSMLADSGWISVSPQLDSVLVTLGDIAQVWSNGKVKKVRGRPVLTTCGLEEANRNSQCVSMTLLVTLPLNSTVSPLLSKWPPLAGSGEDETAMLKKEDDISLGDDDSELIAQEAPMFNSFSFEDYAWKVYHERLLLKDPLIRYRV